MGIFNIFKKTFWKKIFGSKKQIKLGLYGPPNGGKTTIANKICEDWLGEAEAMGSVSAMAHETREIFVKEEIVIKSEKSGRELKFNLIDTPGIATKIDYEDFMKQGMKSKEAKTRSKEATKGVIESIKWLDEMDAVVIVLDSTKDPYSQVNVTIIGNLEARKIPVLIIGNKTDLKKSKIKKIKDAFPQYKVLGLSAKTGKNIDKFYDELFEVTK
ncbi:MAG: Era-like GTP-binding protein [Patescibacteria group bacterium]|nr:Era-like GTP-binding protein [Patescibacteria group bacterium]